MNNTDKIAIITDSCADIPQELSQSENVFVLPMVITCTDGEHLDGVDITASDVYKYLETEQPKTSTPSGESVIEVFNEIREKGYGKVIAIVLASGLSGTFNQLRLFAQDVEDMEIAIYDSKQASVGYGAMVNEAVKAIDEGKDFSAVCKYVEYMIDNTYIYFGIDTLEYLLKGGRIGKAAAIAGSILDLKPILSFDSESGEIYAAAKVRGRKKVEAKLINYIEECVNKMSGHKYVLIAAEGAMLEENKHLLDAVKEACPDYEYSMNVSLGAALSTHLGKGISGVGVVFLN